MKRMRPTLTLYIDLAFCVVVLPLMAVIFPVERWFHNFPWYVVGIFVWLYALYFINRHVVVPMLFGDRRRRMGSCALILLSVAVTYLLARVDLYAPKPNVHDEGITRILPSVLQYRQALWSLFMIVEAFSFAVSLLTQANLQKARRRAVESERDKAEIELYKAQIKPHFMFNTLNSIYGLFLTRNDRALESLEKFIGMMRYIYAGSKADRVSLADEADYIRRYVEIQSLRLNEKTTVDLHVEVNRPGPRVPPMLLITFVENCFKHGVSPEKESTIHISLTEKEGCICLTTENSIFPVGHIGEHIGIDNCRRRLELLFPGRHRLDITDSGDVFCVKLSIQTAS